MRALLITFYFPPAGGGGVQRPLKLAAHLPQFGIEIEVLAPDDPKWIHRDEQLRPPDGVAVTRARYVGPRGRLPAEELYGRRGVDRMIKRLALTPRRFVLPDENATWALTAVPEAIRLVRRGGIDVVITTSPPNSINLIGAAVKRATGVRWVADLRDSVVAKPDRRIDRLAVRIKERTQTTVARVVAAQADAVVAATFKIADEMRSLNPSLRVETIPNGSDFDDFEGLVYRPSDRFRITHTGSFFGTRNPRPFLQSLAESDEAVVARFIGDFRAADRDWAVQLGLADRLELHPFLPHERTLELQRDSEALLLLLPDVGERGRDVPSGKLFEYLAARRPIVAAVPTDGTAANLIREARAGIVTASDDVEGMREAIAELVARWRAGALELPPLEEKLSRRINRFARNTEFASLLRELAQSQTLWSHGHDRRSVVMMSSRTCPDWPRLMELAPALHFKHYTIREAQLSADALVNVGGVNFDEVTICCDLERHVFNPDHTAAAVSRALLASHWFDIREWVSRSPGPAAA